MRVRLGRTILGASLAVAAAGLGIGLGLAAYIPKEDAGDFAVHEWGTFLAMSGSDGAALEGMYHEEHSLPAFVHARSRDQLRLPSVVLKGETPVIYFYTDHPLKVRVDVGFPRGFWTQWYPQAQVVGPQLSQATTPPALKDGRIRWCAEVIPAGKVPPSPGPPPTSSGALWGHAREVDAAYVRTPDRTTSRTGDTPPPLETERFLFYRGLGTAALPVRFDASAGGTLAIDPGGRHGARHVFVLRVEGGRGAYSYLPALSPGQTLREVIPGLAGAKPLTEFTARLADDLAARLTESGLYPREARAMVNTWRTSYFQTEGVRALFVLPRAWTDEVIPMEISPKPRDLVRVMVGRVELLSPERERAAGRAVAGLASPDPAIRARAYDFLRDQGRYVEPVVRRVVAATRDERVRTLGRRLLLTDFVTELRAAVHSAKDGGRVLDEPVFVRAQLGAVLREVGLEAEAKAEGAAVAAALRQRPAPAMEHSDSRAYLRAFARAAEAQGDDRAAADWYDRFIRFGSQVKTAGKQCVGCHQDAGPRDLAWFRDWWAGRNYARATARAGTADDTARRLEDALARNPGDTASAMRLAYLLEARGARAKAEALWTNLLAPEGRTTVVAGADRP
jgi:hypothetical protein